MYVWPSISVHETIVDKLLRVSVSAGALPPPRPGHETRGGLWGQMWRTGPEERRSGGSAAKASVWGLREREMMIMEMSKIKQATDCFYVTFTH